MLQSLLRVMGYPAKKRPWTGFEWSKSPRALAGRLGRAQTSLRALGIEMSFVVRGRRVRGSLG
jgi:hypothetical protein